MPAVEAAQYCSDDFVISITSNCDANIEIPGSFPIRLAPGANYFLAFTYVSGIPDATGWRIAWTLVDDNGDTYPGEERPSVTIMPEVPDNSMNPCGVKNGTIRGTVPTPTTNRQYNAILTILQP